MLVAEKIKGFDKLTPAVADIFRAFLENFYNAWGLEARATLKPISIKLVSEMGFKYLRFDYKMYGKKEWLHIINSHTWY